jgi:hypothetical protein
MKVLVPDNKHFNQFIICDLLAELLTVEILEIFQAFFVLYVFFTFVHQVASGHLADNIFT